MVLFPSLTEALSLILLWEFGQAPRGESNKTAVASWWQDPPGVFNSPSCPHQLSSNFPVTVQVIPLWSLVPGTCSEFHLVSLCPSRLLLCVFAFLSLLLGAEILPYVLTFLKDSSTVGWFFSLFSFLLVGMEWQLLNSLWVELRPKSLLFIYIFFPLCVSVWIFSYFSVYKFITLICCHVQSVPKPSYKLLI